MRPFLILILLVSTQFAMAQKASIREEKISFMTYPYDDPDPVARMTRHYPYFRFDGFSVRPQTKAWKMVVLENPYIKVYVAPDMGGKIWGAIEKSTGEAFIYFNKTVKFRDIAMRGPWTSGGIEFNFGSIGHSPATASPVNYKMMENSDGSVSCFVGAPDLTSRTEWRVEVKLPADKAYFETRGLWYNPNGERTSLYNWMTASTDATPDMEYFFPGHTEIGHGGEASPWPMKEYGRNVAFYRNNDFGGPKSYHVLGSFEEYFGTFFHDKNFGMGHWAPRAERPGAKIWIWGLSRQGEIWVNLLADTTRNEQYTELQTGFLYNQAGRQSTYTPFKHLFLDAHEVHRFSECWFPVKGTKGITKADPHGTLHVIEEDDRCILKFCALQKIKGRLVVVSGGKEIFSRELSLEPMQLLEEPVPISPGIHYTIDIAGVFHYNSTEKEDKITSRPTRLNADYDWESAEGRYTEGVELEKMRFYTEALAKYDEVLNRQPFHTGALTGKANILYRKLDYQGAEQAARKALSVNTYDPAANFIYGMICRQLQKDFEALEAFGLALRSMQYRSAAHVRMAQIYYRRGQMDRAAKHALQSLEYNIHHIEAYRIMALIAQARGNESGKNLYLSKILEIDPLNAFANYEMGMFSEVLSFEMPHEIGLELAIRYASLGEEAEARKLFEEFSGHPIAKYWLAYLSGEMRHIGNALEDSPAFIFPYRKETAVVLKWALKQRPHWKTRYYLALLNWSKGNLEETAGLLSSCGQEPDDAPFYLLRGNFEKELSPDKARGDYLRALALDKKQWRTYHALFDLYTRTAQYPEALKIASEARSIFPDSYIAGFDYARALFGSRQYGECLDILQGITILPYEGARSGHDLYRNANIMLGLDYFREGDYEKSIMQVEEARLWPENLGVGKPYEADERIEDFIQSHCYQELGEEHKANALRQKIVDYTLTPTVHNAFTGGKLNASTLIGARVLKDMGKKEKADSLMDQWLAGRREEGFARWAYALYGGHIREAGELAAKLETTREGTPWDPARQDPSFELVREVLLLPDTGQDR